MKYPTLALGLKPLEVQGQLPQFVTGVTQDSRLVQPGNIFIALKGGQAEGWDYVTEAHRRGAALIITAEPISLDLDLPVIRVENIRQTLVRLACRIYQYPFRKLQLIGITGTNGKTSTTYFIRSILREAGYNCGLIGTIGYYNGRSWTPANLTTPDIDALCRMLAEMVDNGCSFGVMEVSSHGLTLGRTDDIEFAAAGFTGLSLEHQDFHPSMDAYAAAKAQLFERLSRDSLAVVNVGNLWGRRMLEKCRSRVITYSRNHNEADLIVKPLSATLKGSRFQLAGKDLQLEIATPLIGGFQGENIALAVGLTWGLGIPEAALAKGIAAVKTVAGRMERVDCGQPFGVLVDYSHTPDALENALKSLRPLCPGRIIAVFGAGGNRDRAKRPLMGQVVANLADRVIITSDNPRFEDPLAIIDDILNGIADDKLKNVTIEPDRGNAIGCAVNEAQDDDIVLIAGKGHENYIEVKGSRSHFDDRETAAFWLRRAGWTNYSGATT
ncbi:MAG: UDP-N-acetylmuramoyl-L-alanyl-D-glutamate--2,6-diaminopimelate ligase [Calditrichota bacterium]